MDQQPIVNRRRFVAGAGLAVGAAAIGVAITSCGNDDATSDVTKVTKEKNSPDVPGALASVRDVPVGGGIVADGVVLTQQTDGVIKGFSSTCTHSGCTLKDVSNGLINCPCHGSKFHLDGTVAHGPAGRPLPAVPVRVEGEANGKYVVRGN